MTLGSRLVSAIGLVAFALAAQPARVILAGSVHSLARPEFAGGRLPPGMALDRIILLLDAGAQADNNLRSFLDRAHTPGSPDFHQWLTPDEFGARFGAAPSDRERVRTWLEAQGFRIDSMARGGRTIMFSGTVAQVEAAFQTEMRRYTVGGETHIANAVSVSVPADLAPAIKGLVSLNDFFGHPLARKTRPNVLHKGVNDVGPNDFAAIYNLQPLYQAGFNGSGRSIALIEDSDPNLTDFANYRTVFGLPQTTPNLIFSGPDPGVPMGVDGGDFFEAEGDVQQAGGVAPGATLDVYVAAATAIDDGFVLSAYQAIEDNQDDVISMSYGQCEQRIPSSFNSYLDYLWGQATAQGITVVISSGDWGAAYCELNDPANSLATQGLAVSGYASTPYDTAVGGTEFDESAAGGDAVFWNTTNAAGLLSVRGYIPEMVWNESCNGTIAGSTCPGATSLWAGGGGASTLYDKPSWQMLAIPGIPQDGARDLPDVSFQSAAHDNYVYCVNQSCQDTNNPLFEGGFGTSFAAPSFAGIMAIVDQKMGGRQGLANYGLYTLAAAETFANCASTSRTNPATPPSAQCPFNDVVVGNNSIPGQTGYDAAVGYDLASGLGSLNASVLVNLWTAFVSGKRPTTTTFSVSSGSSIHIVHGQGVTITGTVAPQSGSGHPSGMVAFETSNHVTGFDFGYLGNNGVTQFTEDFLPGGAYNLFLSYPGDAAFAGSISNAIPTTVTPEPSGIALGVAPLSALNTQIPPLPTSASVPYGSAAEVLAIVNGNSGNGIATGTVTISTTGLSQQIPLNGDGDAGFNWCFQLTVNCLGTGAYQFSASYSGDPSFNASTASGAATLTVNKATPTISWTPAGLPSSSPLGAAQLNASASFMAGLPAAATAVAGSMAYNPPSGTMLTPGMHTLSVQFTPSSTANFNSASTTTTLLVTGACDVNGDGAYTAADVQAEINEALGVSSPANDLNQDHVVNAIDVQLAAQAVLNQACQG